MVGKDGGKAKPLKQAKAKKNELDEVHAPRRRTRVWAARHLRGYGLCVGRVERTADTRAPSHSTLQRPCPAPALV